jgi:molybdopterin-containing oxidoreductase family iron-sulfur binding subunit
MKRVFKHTAAPETGRKYWRSLEEFSETPEFRARLEREFPQGAAELTGSEVSRRGFVQFMGASLALAGIGLTGCRRPELHGVPYTKGVEWQIPGKALHYATAMPRRGGALPLIATTYNGRPTKLEGNPNVPGFSGATDALAQAAILDLYDPDRSKVVLKAKDRGKDYVEATMEDFWEDFAIIRHAYLKNGGDGLAILTEPSTSPTRGRLRAEVQKQFPKMLWATYEPWASQGYVMDYDLSNIDVIVSLDCDFLGAAEGTVQKIKGFAQGRRRLGANGEKMSRLYAIEGRLSLTGSMADHRLRMPSSSIGGVAALLANKLGAGTGNGFAAFNDPTVDAWLTAMAADLQAAKGRALVLCGSQQPMAVHSAIAALNVALGTKVPTFPPFPKEYYATSSLNDLAEAISQGTIKTLFVLGGNPAFNAPAELGFGDQLTQVEQVIRLGCHVDETSAACTTHVPAAHFLESWGDAVGHGGNYLSIQPLILPLYNGISEIELLGQLAGLPAPKGPEYVQDTFRRAVRVFPYGRNVADMNDMAAAEQSFQDDWRTFVHDGFAAVAGFLEEQSSLVESPGNEKATNPEAQLPLQPDQYELNFTLGTIDDGRYANNGWLQEMPDPITKLTWDNALLMSPATATKLGVNVGTVNDSASDLPDTDFSPRSSNSPIAIDPVTAFPMVRVTTPDGRSLELPVLVAPGQHDQTLTLALGWGRAAQKLTQAERDSVTPPLRVADGAGFNAYLLRTSATPGFVTGVKVEKIDKTYPLAITQEHNSMEGRGLVREASLEKFQSDPTFVQEIGIDQDVPQGQLKGFENYESGYIPPKLYSRDYDPERPAWGMSIDLNTCVGCNACMIACQAENNIPIVGKYQVIRGREMHWIRIDRYFATDVSGGNPTDSKYLEDPQVLFQPMACQHCENAPCEPVCPVNATVHNAEGLNVMAYNRCIGTRYCANNCPYKVRRFNFFNYNDRPIQNVKLPVLGEVGELYLGPLAGRDGPLTYKGSPESVMLQKNPNVSVRIRGVMEKCTYCVQRIEEAKIDQMRKSNADGDGSGDITIATDSFTSACAQACPAEAIVFGNLNDPESKVSKARLDPRNYKVLAYLGTAPRTAYLGRVRNPNPAMPGAEHIGHSSVFEEESPGNEKNGADKPARPVDVPPGPASTDARKLKLEELIG